MVQVDLDASYLNSPESAEERALALARENGVEPKLFRPKHFTATTLPDIPTNFSYMCLPRSVSDMSSKIGLGYIGPRVRRIVNSARFPVLITSPVFKPWRSVTVFFGGSVNALKSLRLGLQIQRSTGFPLTLFTQVESGGRAAYEEAVAKAQLDADLKRAGAQWRFFEEGPFEENIYEVPHDALIVMGAFGHGLIKDFIMGSKAEKVQSTVSNNMLIAGPNFFASL